MDTSVIQISHGPTIFAYFLLVAAFGFIAFYGAGTLLKKWDEAQQKKAQRTAAQFEEMFIFVRRKVLIYLYIIVPMTVGSLAFILSKHLWVTLTALVIGAIIPLWVVNIMDRRRRKKFIVQLVDGLMIMNSCLKGGLTLVQSFEVLAEETSAPMGQEVSLLNREIKVGVPLEEALMRLDKRMPSEEMTLVSSAILVARETGGDLTKVFSRLVETIRDRIKLKELVTTLTLQARLQSIIISMLGPVFFVVVRKLRPDHFDIMWSSELGRLLLLIALILQIIGIILIIIFGRVEI
ncbi:MAG: type II secretion system F family protein [Candidatus Omnitrophica bacterium]|nr:type II secretion system F family protein [Candidatus Omnitrophota bacterium]